jgi:hypothetical protein
VRRGSDRELVLRIALAAGGKELDGGGECSGAVVALVASGVLQWRKWKAESVQRWSRRGGEKKKQAHVVLAVRADSLDETISEEPGSTPTESARQLRDRAEVH